MASKVLDVLDAVRRIVSKWTITTTTLTADAIAGDTIITVDSTLRFIAGNEIVLRDADGNTEPTPGVLTILNVLDNTHLELSEPLQLSWVLANSPSIFKAINGQYIQAVYIGDPPVIPQFPAITVNSKSKPSEWMTTRGTKERYNIEISIFANAADYEDGFRFVHDIAEIIDVGLKHNIYPIVNSFDVYGLTADLVAGDSFVKIADTSKLVCYDRILIENKFKVFESEIVNIVDATTIKVRLSADSDYTVADGSKLIRPHRWIFNSWPAEINFGHIPKGSLLQAAVISWFAEEYQTQFETSWHDPQLS